MIEIDDRRAAVIRGAAGAYDGKGGLDVSRRSKYPLLVLCDRRRAIADESAENRDDGGLVAGESCMRRWSA